MIVDDKKAPVLVNGTLTESFFTVKQENLAHIFSILRNNLYSDKAGAIIREYCTNAYDAHVQAGIKDTPISIKCPTSFHQLLSIRDFGYGLSEEEIFNIYASYGESTKRNTNDQVGMMGLGSKSAFSYTDSFTIISYNQGMQKNYLAYIDDSGIGKVMKVEEKPTTETGIEIQIPVARFDCYKFENAITKQLKFFNPKPDINLAYVQRSLEDSLNVHIHGDGYDIINSYDTHFVVMGNVAYPFTTETFENHPLYKDAINSLTEHSLKIVLYSKIGDVIPSASRESLDLCEKTINWIGEALIKVSDDVKQNLVSQMDSCDTIWNTKVRFSNLKSKFQRILHGYTRDGILCDSNQTDVPKIPLITAKRLNENKFETVEKIYNTSRTVIYVSKGDVTSGSIKKRIKLDNHSSDLIYAVECKDRATYNEFINHPEIVGANIIDLATIELPKIEREKTASNHDAYQFVGDRYTNQPRDAWQKTRVNFKLGTGVYIKISNYSVDGFSPYVIFKMIECLKDLGHEITLHGIRDSDSSKLGDGWKHFKVYVQEVIDNLPQSYKDSASRGYIHDYIDIDTRALYDSFAHLDNDPFNFKQIVDFDNYNYDDTKAIQTISLFINCNFRYDLTKEKQIVNELKELRSKYPLIKYTQIHSGSIPYIKEYIEAMNR